MDAPDGSASPVASGSVVLFVADGDLAARDVFESALLRRFGADYRVVTAGTAADGCGRCSYWAKDGDDVAIVAADVHLPEMDAVEFLQRAYALPPIEPCAAGADGPLSHPGAVQRAARYSAGDRARPD